MNKVGVAVVGCGVWGVNHARVYAELDEARLVKIAEADPGRRRLAGERFDVQCCAEPRDVFRDEEVDAVSICTPTVTHARLAREALRAGKHVLVEKPMATTLPDAEELVRLSERESLVLAVGLVERFNPAVSETLRLVKEGCVGRLLTVHASRLSRRPDRRGDVGVIKDLAMHDVDVVTRVLGAQPVSVFARCGSLSHSFEDYAHLSLMYDDVASGFVEANWLTPRKVRRLTVTGSEGVIRVEYLSQRVSVERLDEFTMIDNGYREPLMLELMDFVDAVLGDREPAVTGVDGVNALRVCEAALRSSEYGRVVRLSELG
jgi:UDP-N-acetylglucosamine 3-dehydrogenase